MPGLQTYREEIPTCTAERGAGGQVAAGPAGGEVQHQQDQRAVLERAPGVQLSRAHDATHHALAIRHAVCLQY